jgi:hypothetical protein
MNGLVTCKANPGSCESTRWQLAMGLWHGARTLSFYVRCSLLPSPIQDRLGSLKDGGGNNTCLPGHPNRSLNVAIP